MTKNERLTDIKEKIDSLVTELYENLPTPVEELTTFTKSQLTLLEPLVVLSMMAENLDGISIKED